MNILFVDDEIKDNLKELFEKAESIAKQFYPNGHTYKKVNVEQALTFLRKNDNEIGKSLDIAVIDRYCPNPNDGERLAKIISDEFPHVSLVMLTGKGDIEERYELAKRLLRMGFCDFIDKSEFHSTLIKAAFERIFSSQSLAVKQKMKTRIETNWLSYIESLKQNGIRWLAYDKARWLLVAKALNQEPALDQTNLSYVLHELQNLCEQDVQKDVSEFTFTKLKNCNEGNAINWLLAIERFCSKEFSESEINALNRAKNERLSGNNIFTRYLFSLRSNLDKNPYNKALLFLYEDKNNQFKALHKFPDIKAIKEKVEKEIKTAIEKPSFSTYITHISNNKTLDVLSDLQKILGQKEHIDYLNKVISFTARWNEAKNNEDFDVAPLEEIRRERNKINKALLDLLRDLQQEGF